jgi:hypothetical protein
MCRLLTAFALLLPLGLAGCAIPTSALTPSASLRAFRAITWSCADTQETRRQVLAHNSVYDTLRTGRRTVYADDCGG